MKESKTIEVKSTSVNNVISLWESFGWEVSSQQRIFNRSQEFTGQTQDYNGNLINNYETRTIDFVQITFAREKSSLWYEEVIVYEKEYKDIDKEIEELQRRGRSSTLYKPKFSIYSFLLILLYGIPFVIYLVVYLIKVSKYKKKKALIDKANDEKKAELNKEMPGLNERKKELIRLAHEVINNSK